MARNKMISCKVCGEQIAKGAKVCPHCGAKNKPPFLVRLLSTIVGIFAVLLIIGAIASTSSEPVKTNTATTTTEKSTPATAAVTQKPTFTVGDTAEMSGISVTLVNAYTSGVSGYVTPDSGNQFLICEFTIENNSRSEMAVSSLLSFKAYVDDYSTNMSLSAIMSADKSQLDGSIAPGKKMNGSIGYEIPQDWKNFEIHFTPSVYSSKEFVFEVENTSH